LNLADTSIFKLITNIETNNLVSNQQGIKAN